MFYKIATIFLFIIGLSCNRGVRLGKEKYGKDGQIISGTTIKECTYPRKTYVKSMDIAVKGIVDSLRFVPVNELEIKVAQTVTRLVDYTSSGLDRDLFYFRMCELVNTRSFTAQQTADFLIKAMEIWDNNEEIKKKSGSSN